MKPPMFIITTVICSKQWFRLVLYTLIVPPSQKNVRICLTKDNTMEYVVVIYKKINIDDIILHDCIYNFFNL